MGGYYLMGKICSSVLIGNGLDIQVGGDDYLNKWIIVRLLAKAKMGKYDKLFPDRKGIKPLITGDELIELFRNMVGIANKARKNEYKDLAERSGDKDLIDTLEDFKKNHTCEIRSIEEIGMEDWLLIFLLFLNEHKDILDRYESIKRGFEIMIFDAIYCEGRIQKLHSKMNKLSKIYFRDFDNIFTLNYDNTIEKLTKHTIFHLHGDFETKYYAEDPQNAYGYFRLQKGQNISFPPQFKHCNCSAILDFSGNRKYNYATNMTKAFLEFERLKEMAQKDEVEFKNNIEKLPTEQQELINIGVERNLECVHNYHFNDFEQLTGVLTIIGLAPQNDSHIFSCINKSNIEKVVFYHYFGEKSDDEVDDEIKSITLPINKYYIIKNIKKLWDKIKISKPNNSITYTKLLLNSERNEFLNLFNSICVGDAVSMEDILWQLKSIPIATERAIYEMMTYEISKSRYHTTPQSEEELFQCFIDFGKTLEVAAISPQSLYCIYITGLQSNNKMKQSKNKKRKRRK